jgi:hypothetical protein
MKNYLENLFDTKNSFVAPAVLIGISIILFAFIIQLGAKNIANKDQSITVTGTAETSVTSDTAKWTISVSERAYGEGAGLAASRAAAASIQNVKAYLIKNGLTEDEITVQTSNLSQICELSAQGYENCSLGVKGQIANQNIIVDSEAVSKIYNISSRIATEFAGANITNNIVEYYYTKLKEDRVDMLAAATKNARERAEAVAKAGGATVGNITSLSSGVFQVTQKNSVSVDDYGMYDTSSIEKKITATVKVNFSVR